MSSFPKIAAPVGILVLAGLGYYIWHYHPFGDGDPSPIIVSDGSIEFRNDKGPKQNSSTQAEVNVSGFVAMDLIFAPCPHGQGHDSTKCNANSGGYTSPALQGSWKLDLYDSSGNHQAALTGDSTLQQVLFTADSGESLTAATSNNGDGPGYLDCLTNPAGGNCGVSLGAVQLTNGGTTGAMQTCSAPDKGHPCTVRIRYCETGSPKPCL
jgi:hypothetical protein